MTLTRKDLGATVVTALAVAVYATTREGWDVWLIGDSRRWATGAILLLGMAGCSLGSAMQEKGAKLDAGIGLLAALGVAALAFAIAAFWTASLTPLSLLVLMIVLLWAFSTLRHAGLLSAPRGPLASGHR